MNLTFLGGAGTVTGSRTLIETDRSAILVDCGLFQGLKDLRLKNREPVPVPLDRLDGVVLTHAHLDHSGACPLLVRQGYEGLFHTTPGTADLCTILWKDAAHLQVEDAERANRRGYSRHKPALPLYDLADAERAAERCEPHQEHAPFRVGEAEFTYREAGHILGAAGVLVQVGHRKVYFSGDVGRNNDPIHGGPEALPDDLDLLVLESTYGDRLHPDVDPEEAIAEVIRDTVARGGNVMVPTFAVGRVQRLLYHLERLIRSGRIPNVPVYLNSPLGEAALRVFKAHPEGHDLDEEGVRRMCALPKLVRTREESIALNQSKQPCVILAGSGMATGGRILHHLKEWGPDPRHSVLLNGFQAAGTRGERLQRGEIELKIFGEMVPIRAQVHTLDNLSAHADANELIAWLGTARRAPARIVLNHGEPGGSGVLARRIAEETGIPCGVASQGMTTEV